MLQSDCCKAELKLEFRVEHLQGCEEIYEIKVPCFVCSVCQAEYGLIYDPETTAQESTSKEER